MSLLTLDADKLADLIAAKLFERLKHQADDPLLPRRQSAEYIGVSLTTFKRLETSPGFPMPKRPNGGHPRWLKSELDSWKGKS